MATQTIERHQELREAHLHTLVVETLPKEEAETRVPSMSAQAAAVAETAPAVTAAPSPWRLVTYLAGIARRLVAFDQWLFGPPLTERDRVRSRTIKAQGDRYIL